MTKADDSFKWKALLQKAWVIVLAGLFVPPVGMILAWLKPEWTTRTRLIATGLMFLLLLGRIGARSEKPAFENNTGGVETKSTVSSPTSDDEGNPDFIAGFDAAVEASRLTPQERGLFLSQIEQDIRTKKDQNAFRRGMAKGFRDANEAVDASLEERRKEQYQKERKSGTTRVVNDSTKKAGVQAASAGGRSEDYQSGYNLGKAHAESLIRVIDIQRNAMKEHGPAFRDQVNESVLRLRQAVQEAKRERDRQRQGLGNALEHYEGRYDGLVQTAASYL
jgi:hypothetical protein